MKAVFNYPIVNMNTKTSKMFEIIEKTKYEKIIDGCSLTYRNLSADIWFYNTFTEVTIGFYKYLDDDYKQRIMNEIGSYANFKKIVARFLRRFIKISWKTGDSDIITVKSSVHESIQYAKKICLSKIELELICDVLEGNDISKYQKSIVKRIVGEELSPLKYEMLVSGDTEIKDINRKYHDMIVKLKDEHRSLANGIEVKARIEMLELQQNFKKKIAAVMKEKKAKLKEVKSLMSL